MTNSQTCGKIGVSVDPRSHTLEFRGMRNIKVEASPALRATDYKCPLVVWGENGAPIRRLTEREYLRLMGVCEGDIDNLLSVSLSRSNLYQLAGNSIVCDVMAGIFTNLFLTEDKSDALSDLW